MLELTESSVPAWVEKHLGYPAHTFTVEALAGGVSSAVFRVQFAPVAHQPDVIVKQSLARLRVAEEWLCERERIFDEIDALHALAPYAPPGSLPMVLAEDRPNFIYAMTAAPAGAPTWKQVLLEGKVDLSLARQAAALAALFLDVPQQLPNLTQRFSTKDRFEQLRVSPYYRHTLHRHPDLAAPIERAIGQALTSTRGLTHGDWSPKNFLIYPDPATQAPRLFSIDYEVTHIGDPAFDCAFLLNHFLLKGWKRPSAQPLYKALALEYVQTVVELTSAGWLEGAALVHLGCLHLARVDGKSPVEYLSPVQQSQVRRFARDLIQNAASTVEEVFERQAESFHE